MRSHVALFFEDRPPHLRERSAGDAFSAEGASHVSWDYTSRPFVGFSVMTAPDSWYFNFKTARVYFYDLQGVDALQLHRAAEMFSESAPPYSRNYGVNSCLTPWFPWRCCCYDLSVKHARRPTNCVGATLTVVAMARQAERTGTVELLPPEQVKDELGLDRLAEWLLPSEALRQLQRDNGAVGDECVRRVQERRAVPLLLMDRC